MSFFLCNFAAQNQITVKSYAGIKYQGYEAIITIKDGVVTGSLPRRALRLVFEWLDQHQDELLANWERLGKSEEPIKIDPLQ